MKKLVALLVALLWVFACNASLAVDVSGYEAHATINLTPFKGENYIGGFDEMSYEATITSRERIYMEMVSSFCAYKFSFYPQIKMKTLMGVEVFTPRLSFDTSDWSRVGGFYCVVGENRYLLSAEIDNSGSYSCSGYIAIGKNMFSILKEIANTTHLVRVCVADNTTNIYTFSAADIAIIKQFVADMEASGLSEQLVDDTVVVITQFN